MGGGGGGESNCISQAAPPLLPLLLKFGARFFASDMIHTLHRCGNQGDTTHNYAFWPVWQMVCLKSVYLFNIIAQNIRYLVPKDR